MHLEVVVLKQLSPGPTLILLSFTFTLTIYNTGTVLLNNGILVLFRWHFETTRKLA
jgi:hypothetical protein